MSKKEEIQKESKENQKEEQKKEQKTIPAEKEETHEQKQQRKEKELIETLQRLQAEFENYKKRVDKEKADFCLYTKADMLRKLLPLVDTFEIALKGKERKDEFVKGMDMIYTELIVMLHKEGVRKIDAVGKKFDSNLHEVLMTEKSDKEDNIITEEFQKGYMLCDRVLRHSKVKVTKNNGKK
ncbi:MAG: nucleotide exchange factor GrpE [Candidatus Woesearchaeota archaeon]|nr:nucleotide exchange factor GrpE [Candidatus Woesearchaeota archaeon]